MGSTWEVWAGSSWGRALDLAAGVAGVRGAGSTCKVCARSTFGMALDGGFAAAGTVAAVAGSEWRGSDSGFVAGTSLCSAPAVSVA